VYETRIPATQERVAAMRTALSSSGRSYVLADACGGKVA
jgi:hypothetical protein